MSKNASATDAPKQVVELGDFGQGRYSPVMRELYSDAQRMLGLSDIQAHACAARLGIDLGRFNTAKADITFSKKLDKNGLRTVREVAKIKMPNSWALSVAVICAGLQSLKEEGLVTIDNGVSKELLEFINKAAERLNSPDEPEAAPTE